MDLLLLGILKGNQKDIVAFLFRHARSDDLHWLPSSSQLHEVSPQLKHKHVLVSAVRVIKELYLSSNQPVGPWIKPQIPQIPPGCAT